MTSMSAPTLAEIHALLRDPALADLPPLDLAVLRNVTVEPLEPFLRYQAAQAGFNARLRFGTFDGILQDALSDDSGVVAASPGGILVFLHLEVFSEALARRLPTLDAATVDAEVDRFAAYVQGTLAGLRGRTQAPILWHGFERPLHPAFGIADSRLERGQLAVVQRLNAVLRQALAAVDNAWFVDLDEVQTLVGARDFHDRRYWHIGRSPFGRAAQRAIAELDFRFLRALNGKAKKCLVLDCDNTLWGGILGEDGLEGIKLGHSFPGSAFRDLQHEIAGLGARGVILALCSKNEADDVWRVFREHPDMVLREEHIAAARINWRDKAANLRELAAELNIGLDAMVFVDDSPVECALVRESLPEVTVIQLPVDQVVEHRWTLAASGLFDTPALSDEDRRRGSMYKAEAQRRELQAQATDLKGFWTSLEMEVVVAHADDFSFPRLAQLEQRTNQFNLTTRRLGEAELRALAAEGGAVLSLALKDRFGDYGIVGMAALRRDGAHAEIVSLMMSCRALGREVERALLAAVVDTARRLGAAALTGVYVPTKKNAQVAGFYPANGFAPAGDGVFRLEAGQTVSCPGHFARVQLP